MFVANSVFCQSGIVFRSMKRNSRGMLLNAIVEFLWLARGNLCKWEAFCADSLKISENSRSRMSRPGLDGEKSAVGLDW